VIADVPIDERIRAATRFGYRRRLRGIASGSALVAEAGAVALSAVTVR
jgi:hypothetical protein